MSTSKDGAFPDEGFYRVTRSDHNISDTTRWWKIIERGDIHWAKEDGAYVQEGEIIASMHLLGDHKTPYLLAKRTGFLERDLLTEEDWKIGTLAKIYPDRLAGFLVLHLGGLSSQNFSMDVASNRINIYYSYDHEDKELKRELEKHLSNLRSQNLIETWHDQDITAGKDWKHTINTYLDKAHIILLLISPDFMASDYRYSIELQYVMQRYSEGQVKVIPILLRPVDQKGTPFDIFPSLPSNGVAITRWNDRDDAFVNVTRGIRKAIQEVLEARLQPLTVSIEGKKASIRVMSEGYHKAKASFERIVRDESLIIQQRESIEQEIVQVSQRLQAIQKDHTDLLKQKAEVELALENIQRQAILLYTEQLRLEAETQKLTIQIDKAKS